MRTVTDARASADVVSTRAGFAQASAVADAVLYEGYALYPYRGSSEKNRVRFQFGVLAPRTWIEARGPVVDGIAGSAESWWQQTECLLEAPPTATLHVRLRYLQLDAEDDDQASFDQAIGREHDVLVPLADLAGPDRPLVLDVAEDLPSTVAVSLDPAAAPFPLHRLRVRVENATRGVPEDLPRPRALRHCLLATHSLVALDAGGFLSLIEPPEWAAAAAAECRNVRTFPVLAGPAGGRDLLLSSPIILYDHPEVAPESPGDLHDASEIDEILSLRLQTLTDAEKQEARATDPRVAAIVDRVDGMPAEVMERLHGAVRSLAPVRRRDDEPQPDAVNELGEPAVPWWGDDAAPHPDPETAGATVAGVEVRRGSRVRLRPRQRGTDAHDMFLTGRAATVDRVLVDVNDVTHVAVTIDDDPSAELHQWYGRFHYFGIGEIEPLETPRGTAP